MEKPQTLQAALEALDNAANHISSLEKDLDAAQQLIEHGAKLQDQLAGAIAKNEELAALVDTLKSQNAALAEAASLNEIKLNEAIAAAGVPPVAIHKTESVASSKEELWAKYKSLSVYDKPSFWSANRAALMS